MNKVKKLILLISSIIILFIVFLIVYLTPRNYEKLYEIDKFVITERYLKDDQSYYYTFKNDDNSFEYILNAKYTNKRKLIDKITVFELNDGYCFLPTGKYLQFVPLCQINGELLDYHLVDELKEKIDSMFYEKVVMLDDNYQNIGISNLNNRKYLIWNYDSFYYLDEQQAKKLKIFATDYYQISLATKINNYLFIPNYDDKYKFSKAYVININNQKINTWNLKKEIYFESRILGTYNKSIYLLDEKEEKLYELVPHKMKFRQIKGKILKNNELLSVDIKDIINKNLEFEYDNIFKYEIINHKLYMVFNNTKLLLSNKDVDKIVDVIDNEVYYLSQDSLYVYSKFKGEVKLLTNFEWSFNNNNIIFIY